MSAADPNALLISNISQYDVDFVIPRIGVDVLWVLTHSFSTRAVIPSTEASTIF